MEEAAIDIFLPVMESAIILASHYCKATGRTSVTGQDMKYGMMYAARYVTGKQVGSLFPEVYEDEEEEEEEEEEDEVDEEEFIRYEGTDEQCLQMNACADSWNEWEPENPAERALKSAVESATNQYV